MKKIKSSSRQKIEEDKDLAYYTGYNKNRIKKFEKFDFIDFFERIGTSLAGDPQYAKICGREIIYSFRIRGPTDGDGKQWHFFGGSTKKSKNRMRNISYGFISALKSIYPELYVQIGSDNLKVTNPLYPKEPRELDLCCIEVSYKPNTKKELEKIISYLRTVPEDSGNLPEKDATFFCYD